VSAEAGAPHLVFVGLAGSGKTTIGRGVAERLNRPFLDLDREILRREGVASVGALFQARGESHFRQMEADLTVALASSRGLVIAPGGGWIMTPGSLEAMQPVAFLVYLKVTPETALKRIGADVGDRPLLDHPDPVGELRRQLEVRGPRYEQAADLVIDAEDLTPAEVIDQVIRMTAGARGS
jgi:shikimate kinase